MNKFKFICNSYKEYLHACGYFGEQPKTNSISTKKYYLIRNGDVTSYCTENEDDTITCSNCDGCDGFVEIKHKQFFRERKINRLNEI